LCLKNQWIHRVQRLFLVRVLGFACVQLVDENVFC
jgi:hypothetical protein